MVRCSKCKKSFKQHTSQSWIEDGMCNKCWKKNRDLKYVEPKTNTRLTNTPMDFYLDQYVQHEVRTIDY